MDLEEQRIRILLNKISIMALNSFTQGGNTKWDNSDVVKSLEELHDRFWPLYKRTPEEEERYQQAIYNY